MPFNQTAKQTEEEEKYGLTRMTSAAIVKLCKKNRLYVTPHLNDVLYLHYQGYQRIESLEPYVGLKCLWLESNAIDELSGLASQTELRCLFLHNNLIKRIENLEHCTHLDTLNLSHNYITCIENCGFAVLPALNTLNLSHNRLQTYDQLQPLVDCTALSVLDLSHNRIDDILVVDIVARMPALRVLVLTGNPVVSAIPMYRKTLINECKELTYLDSRPVFDRDRACAIAWKRGGYEEERKEHERWNRAERRKVRNGVNATLAIRNRNAIAKGLKPEFEMIDSSGDEDDDRAIGDSCESNSRKSADRRYCTRCTSNDCKFTERECSAHRVFDEVAGGEPLQKELYEVDCSGLYDNDYYDKLVDELNQAAKENNLKETEKPIIGDKQSNITTSITHLERSEESESLVNIAEKTLLEIESQKTLYTDSGVHERHRLLIQDMFVKSTQELTNDDIVESAQTSQCMDTKSVDISIDSSSDENDPLAVVTEDDHFDTPESDSDDDSVADLDEIHKELMAVHVPPPPKPKSVLIERLLNSRASIFDIPADELNRQVAALKENNQNELVELVDRVYENREAYLNTDEAADHISDDDSDEYEDAQTDISAERCEVIENVEAHVLNSNAGGITIFCENVAGLLEDVTVEDISSDTTEIIAEEIVEVDDPINDGDVYQVANDVAYEQNVLTDTEPVNDLLESIVRPSLDNTDDIRNELPQNDTKPSEVADPLIEGDVANAIADVLNSSSTDTDTANNLLESIEKHNTADIPNKPPQNTIETIDPTPLTLINDHTSNAHQPAAEHPSPVDPITFDLKYLQSLVYGAPRPSVITNEPMIEAGDFGLAADEAAAVNEDIKQSPAYQRHIAAMEATDRQLEEGIQRIMLDASLEFGMLHELETNGDPNGDNESDILERVERYTSEFKSRLTDEQRQRFHSP